MCVLKTEIYKKTFCLGKFSYCTTWQSAIPIKKEMSRIVLLSPGLATAKTEEACGRGVELKWSGGGKPWVIPIDLMCCSALNTVELYPCTKCSVWNTCWVVICFPGVGSVGMNLHGVRLTGLLLVEGRHVCLARFCHRLDLWHGPVPWWAFSLVVWMVSVFLGHGCTSSAMVLVWGGEASCTSAKVGLTATWQSADSAVETALSLGEPYTGCEEKKKVLGRHMEKAMKSHVWTTVYSLKARELKTQRYWHRQTRK